MLYIIAYKYHLITSVGNFSLAIQGIKENESCLRNLDLNSSRPRMRTQHTHSQPAFSVPTTPPASQFPAPILPPAQIQELTKRALEAHDPNSDIWKWNSSEESTPRGRINSIDSMTDTVSESSFLLNLSVKVNLLTK